MSYYVTTPIYYVNAQPHLGHAYTTIGADILARHMRQRGEDVFFLTGTDEFGEPVAQAAERLGVTPRELADKNSQRFRDLMPKINASNDFFIRTSDPEHGAKVGEVLQRVHDNGFTFEGSYEGFYCPRCADFKTPTELLEGNRCAIHEIVLELETEQNWFFKLSAFQEQLEQLYADQPGFVRPDFRRNEALAFIKGGLQDVSLSRPKLTWGVPLPWAPDQVMYVWFDALLNYYTALSYARPGEDLTERFWPVTLQVMAKDILKFHSVYWPALLMAADLPLPGGLYVHGYLLMDDKKMSKSLGNVLDPFEVIERFGADALRFYCFREVSFGQDGSISPAGFEARYESELANDYGNLASRTLAMIERYRDGVVPEAKVDPVLADGDEGLATLRERVCGGSRIRPSPMARGAVDAAGARLRAARRRRDQPRARGHLGLRAAAQPLRRGEAALGARQGRRAGGRARRGALQPRRGSARRDAAAQRLHAGIDRHPARRARRGEP